MRRSPVKHSVLGLLFLALAVSSSGVDVKEPIHGGKSLSVWMAALRDKDQAVRKEAATALSSIGAPAVPSLIQALMDEKAVVREEASRILGNIGRPALAALTHALKDKNARLREGAVKALGFFSPDEAPAAVPPLLEARRDRDPFIRSCAHYSLGIALHKQGKATEAILEYRKAIELEPNLPHVHWILANALADKGQFPEAITEYRKAIQLEPQNAQLYRSLGSSLHNQGQLAEAIIEYSKAIELDPNDAQAHCALGAALYGQGKLTEAIAEYRKAIRLDPKDAKPHSNLALALEEDGKTRAAIAEYNKAIELEPNDSRVHYNLAHALDDQGKRREAAAEYRKAIELDPKDSKAHLGLGITIFGQGKVAPAISEYRKAIELDSTYYLAHGHLGRALVRHGQFAEAKQATQCCLTLLPADARLQAVLSQQLRECEEMLALDKKLVAILKGEVSVGGAAEQIAVARLCFIKQHFASAARFYSDAFTAEPPFADDLDSGDRYKAACCAALAATGEGEDTAKLDDKERARLRRQALQWIRAELILRGKQAMDGTRQGRQGVQQSLRCWQEGSDPAGLRHATAPVKLPEAERAEWEKLWADVDVLLKKCDESE